MILAKYWFNLRENNFFVLVHNMFDYFLPKNGCGYRGLFWLFEKGIKYFCYLLILNFVAKFGGGFALGGCLKYRAEVSRALLAEFAGKESRSRI